MRKATGFASLLVILLATLALVVSVSCTSLGRIVIAPPQVSLAAVGLKDVTSTGATIVFSVKVENPNSYSLKVKNVRYEVQLNEREFSRGSIELPPEVPAKGQSVIDIPVPVFYRDLFARLVDLLAKEKSKYYIKGTADFGGLTVPFESRGDLKLSS
jgi:LEA14-like dessication related protein